jgi:hypothetical protein
MKNNVVGWALDGEHPPATPGWYSDPGGLFTHRYWDGHRWTTRTGIDGVEHVDRSLADRPAPGFYDDPMGRHQRRYFDGYRWTGMAWTAGARFDEPPASWCPDPTRRHQLRYWNGLEWTSDVSDAGVQGRDAP